MMKGCCMEKSQIFARDLCCLFHVNRGHKNAFADKSLMNALLAVYGNCYFFSVVLPKPPVRSPSASSSTVIPNGGKYP